jgi:hypothetical protein
MQTFEQFLIDEAAHTHRKVQAVLRNYGYEQRRDEPETDGVAKYVHPRLKHTASVSASGWTHSEKRKGGKTAGNLDKHLSKVHQAGLFEEAVKADHELVKPSHDLLLKHGFDYKGKAHSKKEGKFHQFNYQHPTTGMKVKTFINPGAGEHQQVQHHVNGQWMHHNGLADAIKPER